MGMRSKKNKHLRIENNEIYNHYYNQLCGRAQSIFNWPDLPKTCDPWYFEKVLLHDATAAIYNLPANPNMWLSTGYTTGELGIETVYETPASIFGVGYGILSSDIDMSNNESDILANLIDVDKFAICYDNVNHVSILPDLDFFAKRLYEIDQTFRNNLRQQNTPYIVRSDRNTLLTIRNFFNNLFGFDPVIEVRQSSFDTNSIDVLDLRVDFKGLELQECLSTVWKQAMNFLGISENGNKKERMVVQEVNFNRMSDTVALNTRLKPRQEFCKKFTEITGIPVHVEVELDMVDVLPYEERSDGDEHSSANNSGTDNSGTDNPERDNAER